MITLKVVHFSNLGALRCEYDGQVSVGRASPAASHQEGTVESRETYSTSSLPICSRRKRERRVDRESETLCNSKYLLKLQGRAGEWTFVYTKQIHTNIHAHTLVLPPGIIQRSGQYSSPLIMQMNMTLAGLGTRSHQPPHPAPLCISDCVKSCFPIISRHRMDSILL